MYYLKFGEKSSTYSFFVYQLCLNRQHVDDQHCWINLFYSQTWNIPKWKEMPFYFEFVVCMLLRFNFCSFLFESKKERKSYEKCIRWRFFYQTREITRKSVNTCKSFFIKVLYYIIVNCLLTDAGNLFYRYKTYDVTRT